MKMTLKASLSSSTKEIDIYYGDPLLYIRPKEGSYRFPELYTTDAVSYTHLTLPTIRLV